MSSMSVIPTVIPKRYKSGDYGSSHCVCVGKCDRTQFIRTTRHIGVI